MPTGTLARMRIALRAVTRTTRRYLAGNQTTITTPPEAITVEFLPGEIIARGRPVTNRLDRFHAGRKRGNRHTHTDRLFNTPQKIPFFTITEGNRQPGCSRTGRTSNTVNVIFGHIRQIKIEDVGDPLNIYASCGNISRNEDTGVPRTEPFKSVLPLVLGTVAMNHIHVNRCPFQVSHNAISPALRPGKDEGTCNGWILEEVMQQGLFCVPGNHINRLGDLLGGS
jgi:hypothetical protein